MKRVVGFAAALLILWVRSYGGNTWSTDPRFTDEKLQASEKSLQVALESGNDGMQASAAQVVRHMKAIVPLYEFSSLVIPLMRIVKDENAPTANRVLAVLALHELGSARGDFAIKRVGEFTEVRQVKHLCLWLTYERALAQHRQVDSLDNIAGRMK